MSEKEKYELVLEAIEAGGQTDETLIELLGAKGIRAVKMQFKFINVMKKFPHLNEETGTYVILEQAEWDEVQEAAGVSKEAEKKWTAHPQNKRVTLEARLNTKVSRMNAARRKFDAEPRDVALKLKNTVAICEFHLANLTLSDFQKKMCRELSIDFSTYQDIVDLDSTQDEIKAAS